MLKAHRRPCRRPGAIFKSMFSPKPVRACVAALALLMLAPALGAYASSASATTTAPHRLTSKQSLLQSTQLWATIDVCNPPDQPDTVGIRGSMPGDGQSGHMMYMRFRLQYRAANKQWVDLTTEAGSGFVAVGRAKSTRQAGRSFQLVPVPGKPAFLLRGVVSFEWRRGGTVLDSVSRPTSSGRQSLAGADPAGFSAATCSIG
jgi:hypothetical protein